MRSGRLYGRGVRTLSEIARQVLTASLGRGVVRISQLVTFLVLARLLSPAEFGWFGILTTAITVGALLGSLGLRQSFGYEIGQNRRTPNEAAGTALALWLPLSIASAAAIYFLYGRRLPDISQAQAAWIIFVGVAASILVLLMQGINLGQGDIRGFALSESVPRVALMFLSIALALFGSVTLQSSLWAFGGGFVVAAPLVLWLAMNGSGRPRVNFRKLGRTLRYGMIFAFNLLAITLCARLSMFVIERYTGASAAGEFFAATRVNEIFLEAATAVGMVLFSNAARQDKGDAVINRSARIACWMFWLFMIMGGLVMLAAPLVIRLLAGSEYAAAAPALQILALSLAPTAASKIIYPTLSGSGDPHFGTPVIVASLIFNGIVAFALVPSMGLQGGAIALVCGQYLLFAGYVLLCRRRYNVPVRIMLLPRWQDTKQTWNWVVSKLRRRRRS